jgi:hypothetical protein
MPALSTVVLKTKGEFAKASLQLSADGSLTMDTIQKYLKKKEVPEIVCTYEYDSKFIFVFGYKKGKKGTENKVELPDPYSESVMFGDSIAIVSLTYNWDHPIPFTTDQWNTFYTEGGMEDEEEEEEEEEEDDEKVTTDAFDDEEEVEVDVEEEDAPVLKKRMDMYPKVEVILEKDEIAPNSDVSSHPLRMKCLQNMSFLQEQFEEDGVLSLEKGIFDASLQQAKKKYIACNWKLAPFREVYQQIMRFTICNLHPQSPVQNHRLLTRVLDGEFILADIPFMTSYDMFPEKWFALKDKLVQREQKILEGNKSRATDQFKCRRCNKRECTYYELQTRSSDEPMTIFITCVNCGKEWRQGG